MYILLRGQPFSILQYRITDCLGNYGVVKSVYLFLIIIIFFKNYGVVESEITNIEGRYLSL